MNCVRREQRNVTCKNQVKRHRLDQTIDKKRWNSIKHFLGGKFVLAEQFESENEEKARVAFLAFTPPTPWCFTLDFPLCGARKRKATRKREKLPLFIFNQAKRESRKKGNNMCENLKLSPPFSIILQNGFPIHNNSSYSAACLSYSTSPLFPHFQLIFKYLFCIIFLRREWKSF